MACKHCGSSEQEAFQGEMSLAFPGIKRIKQPPVYVCPQILICLKCGAAGFFVPAQELDLVREGMATPIDLSVRRGVSGRKPLIPYGKVPHEKVKLPKRKNKASYDDQAPIRLSRSSLSSA